MATLQIGAVYLWSYVFNIVRASSFPSVKQFDKIHVDESSIETPKSELGSCKEPLLASENQADRYALRSSASDEMVVRSGLKQKIVVVFRNINWKSLFAPSTIGAIVGFVIGVIPLTRKLMVGNDAPLRVIQDSASLLGDGAIPTLNLIMGANLLKGLRGSGIQKSVIFGIIVVRYIALPLIGIFIVRGALRFGFIPQDPLYQFILLLQFAVPPAMNMGTITQLFGAGETECSVIILWAYALASISLTLWSTFFMWLVA
ncbi:protein PIN-LIKES 1-like [Populus alba x Populus x berolinensis]|nr:protein PIN-LIKES 1-like [Populus alba x Populus x berolinensis]